MSNLNITKSKIHSAKILVVGDIMLDRYWFSDVQRISPEAPVPIARVNKTEDRPGGAANVARNIATLGGDVTLLSVIGNDEAAIKLEELLALDKVKTSFIKDNNNPTIVKLRVLAKNQQLIRIDFEEKPNHEILSTALNKFHEIAKDFDLIILSDYGKGGLSHVSKMIEHANQLGKIILIDPKGNDYTKYKGATLLTPNRNELAEATGGMWSTEEELISKANLLKSTLALKHLLVTRSEEGMSLFSENKITNVPTIAQEVFDVSGAGDTVIASLGLFMANGYSIHDAVILANIAASVVVAKIGTATITLDELNLAVNKYLERQ